MKKKPGSHGRGSCIDQIFLKMKLTIFIALCSILGSWASPSYSQTTRLTLKVSDVRIEEFLKSIEDQSEYRFFYSGKIDVDKRISGKFDDESINKILDEALKGTGIQYEVTGRQIILSSTGLVKQGQPSKAVSGKVTDAAGSPLPGVTVVLQGTTTGTITDVDGKYFLSGIASDDILVFSFVGMKSQEIQVAGKSQINVKMSEETIGLEEVVAIGYGTMKKSDLTGSVANVSMTEKILQANVNLGQVMSGIPGVNIEARGGANSEPNLSVRGQTSLSASDRPLVVMDGIIYNGSLSNININDVETIDILKDASAAAVYGSRSANGVVLITTKKGKTQKPVISVDAYVGYQDMTNNPMRVMNADEFAIRLVDWDYQEELYKWYKTSPTSSEGRPVRPDVTDREVVASHLRTYEEQQNYLAGNEIDWVDEVLQTAPMQNYSLSLQGGTDKTSYYLSGSYSNIEGIQLNDELEKITVHTNLETEVNNWLTLGLISSYTYQDNSGLPADLTYARIASPLVNNHIGSDDYDIYLGGELFQPYPLANLYVDNSDKSNELFAVGKAIIVVPWIKGLKYELNYSHRYSNTNVNSFYSEKTPEGVNNKGLAKKNPSEERNWIVNNIVSYSRDFGDHQVNSTFLFSREKISGNSSTLTAEGFDNDMLGYNNMGLGEIASVASSAYEENSLSYMARINYSYLSRYMFTATVRRDGYSGFGADNKWATFPSVSLAWVASEEPFFKDLGFYLKLRTSYGKNGNQGIGRYSSLSKMSTAYYVYGSSTAIGIYPSSLANPDLKWEKTGSFNVGMDFGVLNNKISGSVNVYKAKTEDVLVQKQLPPTAGYANVWTNIGRIDNKGIEFELNTINFDGIFKWKSNFSFSLNRDKIKELYGNRDDRDIGNSWFVGEPIAAIYDYEIAGVWQEEEFFKGEAYNGWYPGQFKYVDQDHNGEIEPTYDRKILGYGSPSYRFSINNTLTYKNFTLSFFINSIQGGDKYYRANNAEMINPLFYMQQRRNNSAINPYWRPDAPTKNTTGIYNVPLQQSGIYQSRSFVRLQDVTISYRLGQRMLDMLRLNLCQVYLSSKNPYVWTNWDGWDPEIGVSDTPLMRNIILGVKLQF